MDEYAEGNHLVAWTSTEPFLRDLAARFLSRGLDRDELAFVLLPLGELGLLQDFVWRGSGVPALVASGRMRAVPSEDVVSRLDSAPEGPGEATRQVLGSLIRESLEAGHAGARILGRVAPLFFERGQEAAAADIEDAARSFRSSCSVLCLYRTAALGDPRSQSATVRLRRAHTHSILEIPEGGIVCDPPPSDPPQGDCG